jgi:methionyl-tRNA formyltransferase
MALKDIRPTIFAAGYKGALFVAKLIEAGIRPLRIATYRQVGDKSGSFDTIVALAHEHGIAAEDNRHPAVNRNDRLVLLVGWQFKLRDGLDRCFVLHDSALPRDRGFSPTVTALLVGSGTLGVSAIQPVEEADTGAIYGSRSIAVPPGTSLKIALELQAAAMVDLASKILRETASGTLAGRPQDQSAATYCLWRDRYDYFIDWRLKAEEVLRWVHALGFPFEAAKGVLNGEVLTIEQAAIGPELSFTLHDPGKLWQIADYRALVVCGAGTLWIERASDFAGNPYRFKSLRSRFLTADNAWITPYLDLPKA